MSILLFNAQFALVSSQMQLTMLLPFLLRSPLLPLPCAFWFLLSMLEYLYKFLLFAITCRKVLVLNHSPKCLIKNA